MTQRAFDHVLIIMFENQYRGYVMENAYMRNLAAQGIEMTNYFGVMHPSQTNYIASIAGELCNVSNDHQPKPPLTQATIVDLIENSPCRLRWKAYMESYIADDTPWQTENFLPKDHYPYVIKHNAFSSFKNILDNQQRWQKINNEAGFWRDLLHDDLPEYAWFTPNMWNDGHYLAGTLHDSLNGARAPVLVDQQAAWLKSFFAGLNFPGPNSKLPPHTLVVVTYDEADFEAFFDKGKKYTYDGPNQIYTVLLGDTISPGQQDEGYNHYSLLKTIEKNFNLGDLNKNDKDANWFQFLWGKEYRWQPSQKTPLGGCRSVKVASYQQQLYVAAVDQHDRLHYRTFNGRDWSPDLTLAEDCSEQLAITANDYALVLAYRDRNCQLRLMHYDLDGGWGRDEPPVCDAIEQLDIVAIPQQQAFLLIYQDGQGQWFSLRYADRNWQQSPDKLCCKSDGPFCLASLGATTLLIYNMPGSQTLACLSYNSAEYNKVTVAEGQYAGPYDNTTVNCWSANAFSLNYFSDAASLITPGEDEPTEQGVHAAGTLAAATLDGVIHLFHSSPGNHQLLSETFSISGTLTPELSVSYDPTLNTTTSNGYGTMAEAGWSNTKPVDGIFRDADSPLAAAILGEQLWLFYQALGSDSIHACYGFYQSNKE